MSNQNREIRRNTPSVHCRGGNSILVYTRVSGKLLLKFRWVKEKLGLESNSEVVRHLISRVYEDMIQHSTRTRAEREAELTGRRYNDG